MVSIGIGLLLIAQAIFSTIVICPSIFKMANAFFGMNAKQYKYYPKHKYDTLFYYLVIGLIILNPVTFGVLGIWFIF